MAEVPGWKPRPRPGHVALPGERITLEPLDPMRHGDDLYAAGHGEPADPRLWTYLPYGPFAPDDFFTWLDVCAANDDPLFYALVPYATARATGMATHMRIVPDHGVIEIGHIWLGPELQRTPAATEAIFLLARHAFDDLGYRRLEWKCNAVNERSMRAAARFGFTYEGTFRQHLVIKGQNRDTAWWSILDSEWAAIRAGFEAWLAPENFDAEGRQRATLEALREAASA